MSAEPYSECMACGASDHGMEDCPTAPNADRDAGQVRLTKVEREMLLEAVFGPNGRLVSDFVSPIFAVVESIKVAALAARQSDPDATERLECVEWGVRCSKGIYAPPSGLEFDARLDLASDKHHDDCVGERALIRRVVRRTVTTGEWEAADDE